MRRGFASHTARMLRAESAAMILLTFFGLLFTLDAAHEAWQAGMRQTGIAIAACSIPGFGGALFADAPLLFVPMAVALALCLLASVQMQKYAVGPYRKHRAHRHRQ